MWISKNKEFRKRGLKTTNEQSSSKDFSRNTDDGALTSSSCKMGGDNFSQSGNLPLQKYCVSNNHERDLIVARLAKESKLILDTGLRVTYFRTTGGSTTTGWRSGLQTKYNWQLVNKHKKRLKREKTHSSLFQCKYETWEDQKLN